MNINDLEYLEIASDKNIEGGIAFADAYSGARARGTFFAATYTNTYTSASSGFWGSSARSSSGSSSVAW